MNKKLLDVYGVVETVEHQGVVSTDVDIYGELLTDLLTPHTGKRIHIIIEDTEGGEGE